MVDYISLDDASGAAVLFHETELRAVYEATGLVGLSAPRDAKRPRPSAWGTITPARSLLDGRAITLNGEVWGADGAQALAEWSTLAGPMSDTLDAPALLKWGVGGLDLQALVKLAGGVAPPLDGAALLNYQAQFWADDPRAYSQTLDTATGATLSVVGGGKVYPYTYPREFNLSAGGAAIVTNAGTAPTPPILRVFGEASGVRILLPTTGEEIILRGSIASGDYVDIDVARRLILLNGTTPRMNLYEPRGSRWFEIPRGTHAVQMLASSFDTSARVDVLTRAAYL